MDPMLMLDRLTSLLPGKRILAFANLAAERAHDAIWIRVIRTALTMNEAEARGYIRARASAVIHRESSRILFDEPSLRPQEDSLLRKATEIAVASVWTQIAALQREAKRETQRETQPRRRAA